MSTMGRDADRYAGKVRQIRTEAERAAHERLVAFRNTAGVFIRRGGHTIRLSYEEAKNLAGEILAHVRAR